MLVEAVVFGRQDGLLHHGGDRINGDDGTTFFAKFTHQETVCGVNSHGNLGMIVGQYVQRWQVGVGKRNDDGDDGNSNRGQTENGKQGINDEDAQGEGHTGLASGRKVWPNYTPGLQGGPKVLYSPSKLLLASQVNYCFCF